MAANKEAETREAVDPQAWVERYGDTLLRFVRARGCNLQIAEDIVQETFLAAWMARREFAGRASEQTWLIGILRRKIADHFRGSIRREAVEVREPKSTSSFDRTGHWIVGPASWHLDPSAAVERQEFWDVFDQCVSKLPPALSDAYRFRDLLELSTEEICQLLDISATNLWTKLYRARASLRKCIERNWFQSNE